MNRLLLLLLLILIGTSARAEHFAQRKDVQAFVKEMTNRHGFDAEALTALFHRTAPIPSVIRAIMPPKDPAVRSWQAYRSRFVEPKRIAAGKRFMHSYATELTRAEMKYGVPAEFVAAIIGIETLYGKQLGRFGTFAALATLAFNYPPRAELFLKELEELLLLAREENRNPTDYFGSYAGALGLPQFLPSSRRRFAVDFDQDGRIDLANSPADAIGSVANFLAEHGWKRDAPIADTVIVAGEGVQALIDEGITPRRSLQEMEAAGVTIRMVGNRDTASGSPGNSQHISELAALIDLITPNAMPEYRLGYRNFYVLTRYNRSSFYAAATMDLAAALRNSK